MVGVEVAVGDEVDLGRPDPGLAEDVGDAPARLPVAGLELGAPEAEAGVEEEHALAPADRVGDDDAELARPGLVSGEPELADVEGDDLGERTSGHRCVTARGAGEWRRGGDSNPRRVAANRISSAAP